MTNNIRRRSPIHITLEELLYITFWKSPRNLQAVKKNNNKDVIEITKKGLNRKENREKILALTTKINGKKLTGVGVAIASAMLTIIDPNQYGIIDFHAWHALYGEKKSLFSAEDYLKYLKDIKKIAEEEGVTPRDIDKGLLVKDTGIAERIIEN
jgi:thermostable 8-oxoguanine DNA glycosylase